MKVSKLLLPLLASGIALATETTSPIETTTTTVELTSPITGNFSINDGQSYVLNHTVETDVPAAET